MHINICLPALASSSSPTRPPLPPSAHSFVCVAICHNFAFLPHFISLLFLYFILFVFAMAPVVMFRFFFRFFRLFLASLSFCPFFAVMRKKITIIIESFVSFAHNFPRSPTTYLPKTVTNHNPTSTTLYLSSLPHFLQLFRSTVQFVQHRLLICYSIFSLPIFRPVSIHLVWVSSSSFLPPLVSTQLSYVHTYITVSVFYLCVSPLLGSVAI